MELINPDDGLYPRMEGPRIIYPLIQDSNDGLNFFWTTTAHLDGDVLDRQSEVFLVSRTWSSTRFHFGDDFDLVRAVFEDWRFLENNPHIDPVEWVKARTCLYFSDKVTLKSIARLQGQGWLERRLKGVSIARCHDVVRQHRERKPQASTYALFFGEKLRTSLSVNLNPSAD